MALTLEDLDRRVTALELAQTARGANAITRLEQKVDAFPRVMVEMIADAEKRMGVKMARSIAESEVRLRGAIDEAVEASEDRLREAFGVSLHASEQRLRTEIVERIGASEQRMIDLLNDRFDAVMVALDRPRGP